MKKNFILLIILNSFLISCTDSVDSDDLLNNDERTFITGFISPSDTVITISISKTLPIFKTALSEEELEPDVNPFLIKNAIVTISDEDKNTISLPYSEDEFVYQIDASYFNIEAGKEYFLNVLVNDQEFKSSCKIPLQKVGEITEKISLKELSNTFETSYASDFNINFKDIPNTENFYIVGGKVITIENSNYINEIYFSDDLFLNDNLGDGITINAKGHLRIYDNIQSLIIQVANVEEIVYNYMRSSSYNKDYLTGDLLTEYTILPDNIEGENGIGIFGGYQITEKEIQFDDL